MDIEKRVTNLENRLNSLIKKIGNDKFYSDADFAGVRQNVSDISPYEVTKIAYYGETEKTFYDVPDGNVSVYFDGLVKNVGFERKDGNLTVFFDALNDQAKITLSISK